MINVSLFAAPLSRKRAARTRLRNEVDSSWGVARVAPSGFELGSSRFYWLLIDILAVWRISHLFYGEDGPWNLLAMLRRWAGSGVWGDLLDCFYCMSLWIAIPFAYFLGDRWKERLVLWPALSGAASLLERLTARERQPPPAIYSEDKEAENVLRQEQGSISGKDSRPPTP